MAVVGTFINKAPNGINMRFLSLLLYEVARIIKTYVWSADVSRHQRWLLSCLPPRGKGQLGNLDEVQKCHTFVPLDSDGVIMTAGEQGGG